jgi:hypothetical protein
MVGKVEFPATGGPGRRMAKTQVFSDKGDTTAISNGTDKANKVHRARKKPLDSLFGGEVYFG